MLTHKADSIDTTLQRAAMQLHDMGVAIPQPVEVSDYLGAHPDLVDLVVPIAQRAGSEFPENAALSLEIFHDPEAEDSYLTLYVRQATYSDATMQKIRRIRAEYMAALTGKSGWFQVTTDFRPLDTR